MSNIHGLSTVKDTKPADNEEFSLGGKSSSTAVLRPTNGPARQDPSSSSSPTSSPSSLSPADIARIARSQLSSSTSSNAPEAGSITLYSNGFVIGNGEFRDASDPKNAESLKILHNGQVPEELEQAIKQTLPPNVTEVKVTLVDKCKEAFVPPKAKFNFAESKGNSLSSSTATSSTATPTFASLKPLKLSLQDGASTSSIQIVTYDRKKVKETVNPTHTVRDLYQHIMAISGKTVPNFELVAGYPPKVLNDPNQTLKDAGLLNSQVQQR